MSAQWQQVEVKDTVSNSIRESEDILDKRPFYA